MSLLNVGTTDWAEILRVLTLFRSVVLNQASFMSDMALTLEFVDAILACNVAQTQHTLLIIP